MLGIKDLLAAALGAQAKVTQKYVPKRCPMRGCGQLNGHEGRHDGQHRQPLTITVPRRTGACVSGAPCRGHSYYAPLRSRKPLRDPAVADRMAAYRAHTEPQHNDAGWVRRAKRRRIAEREAAAHLRQARVDKHAKALR